MMVWGGRGGERPESKKGPKGGPGKNLNFHANEGDPTQDRVPDSQDRNFHAEEGVDPSQKRVLGKKFPS